MRSQAQRAAGRTGEVGSGGQTVVHCLGAQPVTSPVLRGVRPRPCVPLGCAVYGTHLACESGGLKDQQLGPQPSAGCRPADGALPGPRLSQVGSQGPVHAERGVEPGRPQAGPWSWERGVAPCPCVHSPTRGSGHIGRRVRPSILARPRPGSEARVGEQGRAHSASAPGHPLSPRCSLGSAGPDSHAACLGHGAI